MYTACDENQTKLSDFFPLNELLKITNTEIRYTLLVQINVWRFRAKENRVV